MNNISLTIALTVTPENLGDVLGALRDHFDFGKEVALRIAPEAAVPVEEVQPEPKPKAKPKAKAESEDKPEEEKLPASTDASDADLLKKRDAAIQDVMAFFAANPNATVRQQIADIQAKYGVAMFKDIPADRIPEFVMDVSLLKNGTAEA